MRRRTILITGASGRFGAPLAVALSRTHNIVQFDLREPEDAAQREIGKVLVGCITDPGALAEAMDAVDTVIHAAAIPGNMPPFDKLLEINVIGTYNVLEAAGARKELEHFIFLSSLCWHGLLNEPVTATMPLYLPINEAHPTFASIPYATSKVCGETLCRAYVRHYGKPVVALRPSYIVRPDAEATLSPREAPGHPHLLEYVATSDLIRAVELAMDYAPPEGFDAFLCNAVDQISTTPSLEFAERWFPGVPLEREKLAKYGGFGAFIDCAHAREVLGWVPQLRCQR